MNNQVTQKLSTGKLAFSDAPHIYYKIPDMHKTA